MKVTEEQMKQAIFEELDKLGQVTEPQQPDEFTLKEYKEHANRSQEWTRRKLDELCQHGILTKRKYKNSYLYRMAKPS